MWSLSSVDIQLLLQLLIKYILSENQQLDNILIVLSHAELFICQLDLGVIDIHIDVLYHFQIYPCTTCVIVVVTFNS